MAPARDAGCVMRHSGTPAAVCGGETPDAVAAAAAAEAPDALALCVFTGMVMAGRCGGGTAGNDGRVGAPAANGIGGGGWRATAAADDAAATRTVDGGGAVAAAVDLAARESEVVDPRGRPRDFRRWWRTRPRPQRRRRPPV